MPNKHRRPRIQLNVSEDAMILLGVLRITPNARLCPDCAANHLAVEKWDVMKCVRELVVAGLVTCQVSDCGICAGRQLVAAIRFDPFSTSP
jgi:hypothetical protein